MHESPHDERRIKTFRASHDDERFRSEVADRIGGIGLLIGSGRHICSHVIKWFEVLFPRLVPRGLYVVEDIQTHCRDDFGRSSTDAHRPHTTVNYFRRPTTASTTPRSEMSPGACPLRA